MSLNPLALLEKAINEHGSAVILKERLALASDQFSALEKKSVDQAALILQLQSELASLHLQDKEKQSQIDRLTEQIQQKAKGRRPAIQERLLKRIAAEENQTGNWLCGHENIPRQIGELHLGELELAGLVLCISNYSRDNTWMLRHEGRGYLVANGLIE